ncbi:MFS transporter (plasmid) [Clavibacter michiganensis subsp. michiganensis]|uniref:MFS transporter n=1 Tax=Clavibacter michiganensis TaxID=28447 RepID=UPI00235FF36E|nr:MFS transporter [Clavibacter michiganensis]WDD30080.1 MFS transporter [Clavibacter michiganensis subsp. michiganensis]
MNLAQDPSEADGPTFSRRFVRSVTLVSGAGQVADFVLPLFAGAVLGLTAAQAGALLAVGLATSFLLRPLGGIAADRYERTAIAAASALVLGAGYVLVAATATFPVVLTGVLVSRAGGAFLWVALRATAGARHQADPRAFARLMSAEELGAWVVLAPAIALLAAAGYAPTFAAAAACTLIAGVLLASSRRRASTRGSGDVDAARADPLVEARGAVVRGLAARLRPLLAVVTVIGTAEAAVGLLLVLHLQRELGLEPLAIAWVSLPGGIALAVAPPHLHRVTVRYGRTPVLLAAAVAGAAFAGGLALARDPVTIAVLWILSALALAAILPIEQAALTEAAGPARIGRALGLYEATTLLAAALGSLDAGILYDAVPWEAACATSAAVILAGGLVLPQVIRQLAPMQAVG